MFIFSSNSTKYTFEYKLSKPYRVNYQDGLKISPSVMELSIDKTAPRRISADYALSVDYAISGISAELRDLLLVYQDPTPDLINYSIGGLSAELRDILINYQESSPELVDYTIGSLSGELKDVLIIHEIETDNLNYVFGNISGVIENV